MKLSTGVEWAVHCCVALAGAPRPVPAAKLASLHGVSASYLAKHLQALSRAGLVSASAGGSGGYSLTRPPAEITLLEVVIAVEGDAPAFTCTEVRQRGPLAAAPEDCRRACPIARAMLAAEAAWRSSLRSTTLADISGTVARESGAETLTRIREWLVSDSTPGQ